MIIFPIVLCVVLVSSGTYQEENVDTPFNNSVNVRTVLFREQDTCRRCWSKYDLNLLIARRLVQDLIPRKIPKDFQALLKYFTYLLEEVKAKFPQKNIQIMMLAMYDALGGYLYSVVMPILNEAYYAGNVDYKTVAQLHNMLGVMMDYLATNGRGWAPQCDMRHIATKVAPLPLKMGKIESPCDAFVIPFLSQNKSTGEEENSPADSALTESKIQIPFLDDNSYPSALAVPLKEHPLFSLMSECAVNIVPKFYILAMRCLSCTPFTKKDVLAFNKNLHRWIITTVVPHLHETNRWYPGFGSIMRVVETMNQRGLASTEKLKPEYSSGPVETSADLPAELLCDLGLGGGEPLWKYILLALIALLIIIFLCCCLHCCVFLVRRRRDGLQECDEDEKSVNPLINIYCGLKKRGPEKGERRTRWTTRSDRSTVKSVKSMKSTRTSHPSCLNETNMDHCKLSEADKKVLLIQGYTVERLLKEGTYGLVYLAEYTSPTNEKFPTDVGGKVALKVMGTDEQPMAFLTKLLPRELTIHSRVSHPHIVQLHSVVQIAGKVILATREVGYHAVNTQETCGSIFSGAIFDEAKMFLDMNDMKVNDSEVIKDD